MVRCYEVIKWLWSTHTAVIVIYLIIILLLLHPFNFCSWYLTAILESTMNSHHSHRVKDVKQASMASSKVWKQRTSAASAQLECTLLLKVLHPNRIVMLVHLAKLQTQLATRKKRIASNARTTPSRRPQDRQYARLQRSARWYSLEVQLSLVSTLSFSL